MIRTIKSLSVYNRIALEAFRCKNLVCAIIEMSIEDYLYGNKRYENKKNINPNSKRYRYYKEAKKFLISDGLDRLVEDFRINICIGQIRKELKIVKE